MSVLDDILKDLETTTQASPQLPVATPAQDDTSSVLDDILADLEGVSPEYDFATATSSSTAVSTQGEEEGPAFSDRVLDIARFLWEGGVAESAGLGDVALSPEETGAAIGVAATRIPEAFLGQVRTAAQEASKSPEERMESWHKDLTSGEPFVPGADPMLVSLIKFIGPERVINTTEKGRLFLKNVSDHLRKEVPELSDDKAVENMEDAWKKVSNPRWWTANILTNLDTMAAFFAGGALAQKAMAAGIGRTTLSPKAFKWVTRVSGVTFSAAANSLLEGGLAWWEAKDAGKTDEEAAKIAAQTQKSAAMLTAATSGLGIFGLAGKGGALARVGRGATEALEEGLMELNNNIIQGRENIWEGVFEATALGAAFGLPEAVGADVLLEQEEGARADARKPKEEELAAILKNIGGENFTQVVRAIHEQRLVEASIGEAEEGETFGRGTFRTRAEEERAGRQQALEETLTPLAREDTQRLYDTLFSLEEGGDYHKLLTQAAVEQGMEESEALALSPLALERRLTGVLGDMEGTGLELEADAGAQVFAIRSLGERVKSRKLRERVRKSLANVRGIGDVRVERPDGSELTAALKEAEDIEDVAIALEVYAPEGGDALEALGKDRLASIGKMMGLPPETLRGEEPVLRERIRKGIEAARESALSEGRLQTVGIAPVRSEARPQRTGAQEDFLGSMEGTGETGEAPPVATREGGLSVEALRAMDEGQVKTLSDRQVRATLKKLKIPRGRTKAASLNRLTALRRNLSALEGQTQEDLGKNTVSKLKNIAGILGLKVKGKRKADLVSSILTRRDALLGQVAPQGDRPPVARPAAQDILPTPETAPEPEEASQTEGETFSAQDAPPEAIEMARAMADFDMDRLSSGAFQGRDGWEVLFEAAKKLGLNPQRPTPGKRGSGTTSGQLREMILKRRDEILSPQGREDAEAEAPPVARIASAVRKAAAARKPAAPQAPAARAAQDILPTQEALPEDLSGLSGEDLGERTRATVKAKTDLTRSIVQRRTQGVPVEELQEDIARRDQMASDLARLSKEQASRMKAQRKAEGEPRMEAFLGEVAETADQTALKRAKRMDRRGSDNEAIRKDTGWFKGPDGKWRFELDDSKARASWPGSEAVAPEESGISTGKTTPDETTLGRVLQHPGLYDAYPQLRDMKVRKTHTFGIEASYDSDAKVIGVDASFLKDATPGKLLDTLLHEVQHAIQDIEGFARGGNLDMFSPTMEERQRKDKALFETTVGRDNLEQYAAQEGFARGDGRAENLAHLILRDVENPNEDELRSMRFGDLTEEERDERMIGARLDALRMLERLERMSQKDPRIQLAVRLYRQRDRAREKKNRLVYGDHKTSAIKDLGGKHGLDIRHEGIVADIIQEYLDKGKLSDQRYNTIKRYYEPLTVGETDPVGEGLAIQNFLLEASRDKDVLAAVQANKEEAEAAARFGEAASGVESLLMNVGRNFGFRHEYASGYLDMLVEYLSGGKDQENFLDRTVDRLSHIDIADFTPERKFFAGDEAKAALKNLKAKALLDEEVVDYLMAVAQQDEHVRMSEEAMAKYERLAGEVESRNVTRRRGFRPSEREGVAPALSTGQRVNFTIVEQGQAPSLLESRPTRAEVISQVFSEGTLAQLDEDILAPLAQMMGLSPAQGRDALLSQLSSLGQYASDIVGLTTEDLRRQGDEYLFEAARILGVGDATPSALLSRARRIATLSADLLEGRPTQPLAPDMKTPEGRQERAEELSRGRGELPEPPLLSDLTRRNVPKNRPVYATPGGFLILQGRIRTLAQYRESLDGAHTVADVVFASRAYESSLEEGRAAIEKAGVGSVEEDDIQGMRNIIVSLGSARAGVSPQRFNAMMNNMLLAPTDKVATGKAPDKPNRNHKRTIPSSRELSGAGPLMELVQLSTTEEELTRAIERAEFGVRLGYVTREEMKNLRGWVYLQRSLRQKPFRPKDVRQEASTFTAPTPRLSSVQAAPQQEAPTRRRRTVRDDEAPPVARTATPEETRRNQQAAAQEAEEVGEESRVKEVIDTIDATDEEVLANDLTADELDAAMPETGQPDESDLLAESLRIQGREGEARIQEPDFPSGPFSTPTPIRSVGDAATFFSRQGRPLRAIYDLDTGDLIAGDSEAVIHVEIADQAGAKRFVPMFLFQHFEGPKKGRYGVEFDNQLRFNRMRGMTTVKADDLSPEMFEKVLNAVGAAEEADEGDWLRYGFDFSRGRMHEDPAGDLYRRIRTYQEERARQEREAEEEDPPSLEDLEHAHEAITHASEMMDAARERILAEGDKGTRILASTMPQAFREGRVEDLKGKSLRSEEDVAVAGQVLRDPRIETMRIIYVSGSDRVVVGGRSYSSRMAGTTDDFFTSDARLHDLEKKYLLGQMTPQEYASQKDRLYQTIAGEIDAEMKALGGDGYYIVHNHPLGRSTRPSRGDREATERIAKHLPKMVSHIIVDNYIYSTLTPDGQGGFSEEVDLDLPQGVGGSLRAGPFDAPLSDAALEAVAVRIGSTRNIPEEYADAFGGELPALLREMGTDEAATQFAREILSELYAPRDFSARSFLGEITTDPNSYLSYAKSLATANGAVALFYARKIGRARGAPVLEITGVEEVALGDWADADKMFSYLREGRVRHGADHVFAYYLGEGVDSNHVVYRTSEALIAGGLLEDTTFRLFEDLFEGVNAQHLYEHGEWIQRNDVFYVGERLEEPEIPLDVDPTGQVNRRWEKSHGRFSDVDRSVFSRAAGAWEAVRVNFTREFTALPHATTKEAKKRAKALGVSEKVAMEDLKAFARTRSRLNRLFKERPVAEDAAVRLLVDIQGGLSDGELDLMEKVLISRDLLYELSRGMLVFKPDERGVMRTHFGLTEDGLKRLNTWAEGEARRSEKVQKALSERAELMKMLRQDYAEAWKSLGIDVTNRFANETYFRHQVLTYYRGMTLKNMGGVMASPRRLAFMKRRHGGRAGLRDFNKPFEDAEAEAVARELSLETGTPIDKVRSQLAPEFRGEDLDFNTSYLEAEAEVIAGMLYSTEVGRVLQALKEDMDIRPQLEAQFNGMSQAERERRGIQTWRNLIPEDYERYQPVEGSLFFMTQSADEYKVEAFLKGALEEGGYDQNDLAELFNDILGVGGPMPEIVVPKEVAHTLSAVEKNSPNSAVARLHRPFVRAMKKIMLVSPHRIVRFNVRNMIGDLDFTYLGNPGIFTRGRGNLSTALKDLFDMMVLGKNPGPNLQAWIDQGGFSTLYTTQEFRSNPTLLRSFEEVLGEKRGSSLKQLAAAAEKMVKNPLSIPTSAWRAYFNTAQSVSDFREAFLRYANFLDFKSQMEESPQGLPRSWGASIPEEVMAQEDINSRAWKLSNDLLGAYDEVSNAGSWVRQNAAWFWSWAETAARRYHRLFVNHKNEGRIAEFFARKALGTTARTGYRAYRLGMFAAKAHVLWALFGALTYAFQRDEWEELPEDIKWRPVILLGRNSDGSVRYFTRLGALQEILSWFGLDDYPGDVRDLLNGRRTLRQIADDSVDDFESKLVNMVRADLKTPVELLSGENYFPSVSNPRPIRDKALHLARSLAVESEYRLFSQHIPERTDQFPFLAFTRPKMPNRPLWTEFRDLYAYSIDPREAGYRQVWADMNAWLKATNQQEDTSFISPKSNALYNLKQAVRWGDKEAEGDWLTRYFAYGGTLQGIRQGLENMEPLSGLSNDQKAAYLRHIQDDQTAKNALARGILWWEEVLMGPTGVEGLVNAYLPLVKKRATSAEIRAFIRRSMTDAADLSVQSALETNQEQRRRLSRRSENITREVGRLMSAWGGDVGAVAPTAEDAATIRSTVNQRLKMRLIDDILGKPTLRGTAEP